MFDESAEQLESGENGHRRFEKIKHVPHIHKEFSTDLDAENRKLLKAEEEIQRIAGHRVTYAEGLEVVDIPPEVNDKNYQFAKEEITEMLSDREKVKVHNLDSLADVAGSGIGGAIENIVVHDGRQVIKDNQPYQRYIVFKQLDNQDQIVVVQICRDMPGSNGLIPFDGLVRFEKHQVGIPEPIYVVQFRIGGVPHSARNDLAPEEISSEKYVEQKKIGLGKMERKKVKSTPLTNQRHASGYWQDLRQALSDLNKSHNLPTGGNEIAPLVII